MRSFDPAEPGLSRRQFLFALSAGVVGGLHIDNLKRLATDDGVVSGRLRDAAIVDASLSADPLDLGSPSDDAGDPLTLRDIDDPPTGSPDATASRGERPASSSASAQPARVDGAPDTTQIDPTGTAGEPGVDTRRSNSATDLEGELGEAPALSAAPPAPDFGASTPRFEGTNLTGWAIVLGDSRHTATGLPEVSADDIAIDHRSDRSVLVANRHGRGVMAHNTTYLRVVDDASVDTVHRSRMEFRTPVLPEPISGKPNGQTVEFALFAWDGEDSRRDIGLAFQWGVNPWSDNFGAIRTWTSDAQQSRWSPEPIAWLDPSDQWQTIEMTLHPRERFAEMLVNGELIPAQCTETKKPDNWAWRTTAAMSAEVISIWPGDRVEAPTTRLECRDWSWHWEPAV